MSSTHVEKDRVLCDIEGYAVFNYFYSTIMLIVGLGIIVCFLIAIAILIYTFNIVFLFYCWPILVGIWLGIRGAGQQGYEKVITEKNHPRLHKIIDRVCSKNNTRRPDKVILTEGVDVGVQGIWKKTLIVGVVAIRFLTEDELASIIAHEYGHFARKDTVIGYLTYRIQSFIEIQRAFSRANLATSIMIIFYLPTWLIFLGLSKYYSIITMWYRRRQEYLADKYASDLFGSQRFANALIKYCAIAEIFENVVPRAIQELIPQNRRLINIYDYAASCLTEANLRIASKKVLSTRSGWWSSHPSLSERLEMLRIHTTTIEMKLPNPQLLENQQKEEEQASDRISNQIYYWTRLAAMQQMQQRE